MRKNNRRGRIEKAFVFASIAFFAFVFLISEGFAAPVGPGSGNINVTDNETYAGQATGEQVTIAGGYIASLNVTADVVNDRWKGFVGWVNGQLALKDASGDTLYDWSLAVSTGEVYATITSGTVAWSTINCTNTTYMELENADFGFSNIYDNITATFSDTTHSAFTIGGVSIPGNDCPTLNTYIANVSQDTDFEEIALYDFSANNNTVYATILEDSLAGFDGTGYDFQMIVPQNDTSGAAVTSYYIYVEII